MSLKSLPDGKLAVGTSDPALLLFDRQGNMLFDLHPRIADLRNQYKHFRISTDGQQLAFGLKALGKEPVWFDLKNRRLRQGKVNSTTQIQTRLTDLGYSLGAIDGKTGPKTRAAAAAYRLDNGIDGKGLDSHLQKALGVIPLSSPRTHARGMNVINWKSKFNPSLNGKPLILNQYEESRSLTIAPDGQRFLLGTNWSLRLFDDQGNELWQQSAPGDAWGVNISGDGRFAVAAFGDGTIRWYRMNDGKPLLSLFVTNDAKEWVLWSPSGYYDASPGGDRLIGWHVNNGKDKVADFYPAAQMRERFYRPQVIAHVLTELDEEKALEKAGEGASTSIAEGLPPTVELPSPANGSSFSQSQVTLRYRIHNRDDAPVSDVRLLVDGRPLDSATQRGLKRISEDSLSMEITLPERDLELALIAESRYGSSVPATARLNWDGRKAAPGAFVIKPRLYVLAIGVSDYEDDSLDLQFAAKDAGDFADALKGQGELLYREVLVKLLTDANSDDLLDGLDWLRNEVTSQDVAMLFLAGHGVNDSEGDYYFLPRNANTDRLRRTAIAYFDIKKTLSNLAGKTLAFIDTCHAGNIMGKRRGVADINAVINDLSAAENGVVVFASSSGKQYSLEDSKWGNGAFTKALVEGINGKADYTKDGTITINQLDLYLSERVKKLTGNQQIPTTTKPQTISDVPVVVIGP